MIDWRSFPDSKNLIHSAAVELNQFISQPTKHRVALMLSGGKTPLPIYQAVTTMNRKTNPNLHLLFSDERHVPLQSPESNFGQTFPFILKLKIPHQKVLRVETEYPLDLSAERYSLFLDLFSAQGGSFELGLLGLGEDGHTASLFSLSDLNQPAGVFAIPVSRPEPPDRVSLTPHALSLFKRIIVPVIGSSKQAVLEQLKKDPESLVAGQLFLKCPQVEIWHYTQPSH